MSSEDVAAPPEQGVTTSAPPPPPPPAPNLTAAAAAATAVLMMPSYENETSVSAPTLATATASANASNAEENGKVSAYDKKWLENFNKLRPCIQEDGTIDYSSLDEETQKHMSNFVKDQRKCYRKRENNEPTPLTDERFRLLNEAHFDFKPSETKKGKQWCELVNSL